MLIRVTTTIETVVQVDDSLGLETACTTARNIVRDDHCAVIRLDLETESPKPNIPRMESKWISGEKVLPPGAKGWYPWNENGATDSKTCGEILA